MSTTDDEPRVRHEGDFVITRAEFYRLWDHGKVTIEHEYMPTFDHYDWNGRMHRHFDGIAVRWDNGDPGDEHDGD